MDVRPQIDQREKSNAHISYLMIPAEKSVYRGLLPDSVSVNVQEWVDVFQECKVTDTEASPVCLLATMTAVYELSAWSISLKRLWLFLFGILGCVVPFATVVNLILNVMSEAAVTTSSGSLFRESTIRFVKK